MTLIKDDLFHHYFLQKMAEDKINPEIQSSQDGTVQSSQESEILSQETFNILWKK